MKLIKVSKEGEVNYFSTQAKASKWLNVQPSQIRSAIVFKNRCKGYNIEESYDVVYSNEIDKNME